MKLQCSNPECETRTGERPTKVVVNPPLAVDADGYVDAQHLEDTIKAVLKDETIEKTCYWCEAPVHDIEGVAPINLYGQMHVPPDDSCTKIHLCLRLTQSKAEQLLDLIKHMDAQKPPPHVVGPYGLSGIEDQTVKVNVNADIDDSAMSTEDCAKAIYRFENGQWLVETQHPFSMIWPEEGEQSFDDVLTTITVMKEAKGSILFWEVRYGPHLLSTPEVTRAFLEDFLKDGERE